MMCRIESRRQFLLVAYSYGTLIAIELVSRLEKLHFRGQLVFIDGAPEQLKALKDQFIPDTTADELQNNIFLNLMDIVEPTNSGKVFIVINIMPTDINFFRSNNLIFPQLLSQLSKCTSWNDKLNTFISHFPPEYTKLSIDCSKAWCLTIYNHIRALHEYDMTQIPKITSPIILLKPTVQSLRLSDEDNGLHKVLGMTFLRM